MTPTKPVSKRFQKLLDRYPVDPNLADEKEFPIVMQPDGNGIRYLPNSGLLTWVIGGRTPGGWVLVLAGVSDLNGGAARKKPKYQYTEHFVRIESL